MLSGAVSVAFSAESASGVLYGADPESPRLDEGLLLRDSGRTAS